MPTCFVSNRVILTCSLTLTVTLTPTIVAQWVSLSAAAVNREIILANWAASFAQAKMQGEDGYLQPNSVYNQDNDLVFEVPEDLVVRYYFLDETDLVNKAIELQTIVARLQGVGVEVEELTETLTVLDYRRLGTNAALPQETVELPIGSLVIDMAQAHKHFIQAHLSDQSYVPFPYFYDVTAWSSPLLENVSGGFSGDTSLSPVSVPLATAAMPRQKVPTAAAAGETAARVDGRVLLLQESGDLLDVRESFLFLKFTLEYQWDVEDVVTALPGTITADMLENVDFLVVPHINAAQVLTSSSPKPSPSASHMHNVHINIYTHIYIYIYIYIHSFLRCMHPLCLSSVIVHPLCSIPN
jgi:hypothetical protein